MSATACLARLTAPAERSLAEHARIGPLGHDRQWVLAVASRSRRRLPRGHHLFIDGDPLTHLHLVLAGSLKVYATSLGGEEQVLGFSLRDDVLGLEAIAGCRHAYSAIAMETTDVVELSLARLQMESCTALACGEPGLLQKLFCHAMAREYTARRSRCAKFAERRLGLFLIGLWDRLDVDARAHGELSLPMSRRDIGNHLGMALETVSRHLSQMERQSILQVNRRCVRVLDVERLHEVAGVPATRIRSRAPRTAPPFEHHTEIAR